GLVRKIADIEGCVHCLIIADGQGINPKVREYLVPDIVSICIAGHRKWAEIIPKFYAGYKMLHVQGSPPFRDLFGIQAAGKHGCIEDSAGSTVDMGKLHA